MTKTEVEFYIPSEIDWVSFYVCDKCGNSELRVGRFNGEIYGLKDENKCPRCGEKSNEGEPEDEIMDYVGGFQRPDLTFDWQGRSW